MEKKIPIGKIVSNILTAIFFIIILVPFVMVFFTAFKTTMEVHDMPYRPLLRRILPDDFTNFANIVNVWNGTAKQLNGVPFHRFIINSLIVTFCTLVPSLILSLTSAYGFAKYNFPGKNLIFYMFLGLVMVPMEMISIPLFMSISKMNLINTYPGLMVTNLISAFGTFLLKEAMEPISMSYIEAGRIDGAGEFTIFTRLITPMLSGPIVTFIVIKCTWCWNEFFWPMLVVSTENMKTVTLGLSKFSNDLFQEYGELNAAVLISMLPLLLVFIFANKHIKVGLMGSGLKG